MKAVCWPVGFVLVGVAASLLARPGVAVGSPQTREIRSVGVTVQTSLDNQLVAQINRVRADHHLRALRLGGALAAAAADHSREMASDGYFAHASPDGSSFWQRLMRFYTAAGFLRWNVGETLLWASPNTDAAEAVRDWLASPPHRNILLDPGWRELGVAAVHEVKAPGVYREREVTIVTVDYGVRTR